MSPEEVQKVICTTFSSPMQLLPEDIDERRFFPFKYLQRLGAGSRTLHVPVISSSITWNGRQVATLAESGEMIYIMANSPLNINFGDESDSEESLPDVKIPGRKQSKYKGIFTDWLVKGVLTVFSITLVSIVLKTPLMMMW